MTFPPNKSDYIIKSNVENEKIELLINESINSFSSSVTVYKDKKKILDLYNKNDNKLIETLSITKSFCAMAIMFLIQDGLIDSIDDLISKYIESWNYGKKKDITIKHILTHSSGLDTYWSYDDFMWPKGNYDLLSNGKATKPNVEELSLVIDKIYDNDKRWYYNNTATQVIPTLIKKITNIDISAYLNNKLFKPLGIEYEWNKDDYGNYYGPNGLIISTDGLCKVGILIMNDGIWEGKKILDSSLINEMTKKRITQEEIRKCDMFSDSDKTGYGLLWYQYKNMIIAEGYLGQQLIIDKTNKMVASRLIEIKWENENFDEESNYNKIKFGNFKNIILLYNAN